MLGVDRITKTYCESDAKSICHQYVNTAYEMSVTWEFLKHILCMILIEQILSFTVIVKLLSYCNN